MAAPTGRREANKQAVRATLGAAAKKLFAEQGYEATTVRDIARAAKVTERTFYRYFEGKEGLLAEEYLSWLGVFQQAIRARPGGEPPLTAVRRAMISVSQLAGAGGGPPPLWMFSEFSDRPPLARLRSGLRPLLRFEAVVADAVSARLRAGRAAGDAPADPDEQFRAQVIARVAVAAFRTAVIRHRELRAGGETAPQTVGQLLDHAFAVIASQAPSG